METPQFGLTTQMRDTLLVIQELSALDGRAPSYREVCHEMGFASRSEIVRLVRSLRERGFIDYLPQRARSLVVLRPIPMPDDLEIVGFFSRGS